MKGLSGKRLSYLMAAREELALRPQKGFSRKGRGYMCSTVMKRRVSA